MTEAYFTFGQEHEHVINGQIFDKDCVVWIESEDPRQTMFDTFGRKWSMQYDEPPKHETLSARHHRIVCHLILAMSAIRCKFQPSKARRRAQKSQIKNMNDTENQRAKEQAKSQIESIVEMVKDLDSRSARGADMGRPDRLPNDPQAPVVLHLERLRMVDGDYDSGGAYWGGPVPSGSMHAAWNDDGVQVFVRAKDIQDAQAKVRAVLPGAALDDQTALDSFTREYIMAALWTFDEDAPGGDWDQSGRELDMLPQIDTASLAKMVEDCRRFCEANAELLASVGSMEQNGHDFWLTRNHHGAGFWDRGYGSLGDLLTKAAHAFGECDLYRGDDGRIYI